MEISTNENLVTVETGFLDIYTAELLAEAISNIFETNQEKLVLNMKKVEKISTPALQVILSAVASYDKVAIENIHQELAKDIELMGVKI